MYVETFKTYVIGFIVKCHVLDVILTDNLLYQSQFGDTDYITH